MIADTLRHRFFSAILIVPLLLAQAAGAAPKPNFVFVYTDDQRFDAMSVVQKEQGEKGRWPFTETPNMDRLAREGVRFRNAFVVNSLCAPSRATFLTGCYGYVNGVVNNHTAFPESSVTYATQLRAAGYTTGYVGKWHMGNQSGQRPGFDYSASFVGQGKYEDCPFEINGKSTPTEGWVDDVSTGFALDFIREHKDKPFVLAVGFKSPHGPCTPPARLSTFYGEAQSRTVPNLSIPAIYLNDPTYGTAQPAPPGVMNTKMDYHRTIHGADENLGHILDELDKLGLANNTMVIFTSDNGYYLGEHKLGDKRSAYEESMRVPMIVRFPKLAGKGKVVDTSVLNLDIAPTMLDFAGATIPSQIQGRSWKPLLEGNGAADWRRAFFYCYYFERSFRTPTMMAVRTDNAKLVKYPGHEEWTELFDIHADPFEMKNLIRDPAAANLRKELEATYDAEAKKIGFTVPAYADVPGKEDENPKGKKKAGRNAGPPPPRPKQVVLDYHFDQDTTAEKAEDHSGNANHGKAAGVPLVEGREGRKARRFDGQGVISVAKSPTLSPASDRWSIEVTFKADKPSGILLAHGGASIGYCLYLKEGKLVFTIHTHPDATKTLSTPAALPEGWTTAAVKITPNHRLALLVNGQEAASTTLAQFINAEPNDVLDIGADKGSPVVGKEDEVPFVGLMEAVRIRTE